MLKMNQSYFALTPLFCILILLFPKQTNSLECYVCKNQEDNLGKCVKTIHSCDIGEDRCLSEVRWGSTPYWAASGEKQYYISKKCATSDNCEPANKSVSRKCDRIWYNDWTCVECCTGDRCNYYVTLSAHSTNPSPFAIILSTAIALILLK